MAFRDIVGHERAVGFLRRTIRTGRAGASLVFHGPEGVGRRAVALALAQAFNCPEEPGEGCGRCGVCGRIAHVESDRIPEGEHKGDARAFTRHADVHLVVPGKEEIRIDAIRALRRRAQQRPFEGARAVFIVDPAERMTTEAANALLKTLEEPPPSACLVLVASDPDALLPTVRSRCRLIPFHPLPLADVARHLVGSRGLTDADAALVAALSAGRIGRALSFDVEAYREARSAVLEVLGRLAEDRPRAHVLKDAELLGARGDAGDVAVALEILETILRDAMVLHAGAEVSRLINRDAEAQLRGVAAALRHALPEALARLGRARRDLAANVNRQLLVETLLLDLAPARA